MDVCHDASVYSNCMLRLRTSSPVTTCNTRFSCNHYPVADERSDGVVSNSQIDHSDDGEKCAFCLDKMTLPTPQCTLENTTDRTSLSCGSGFVDNVQSTFKMSTDNGQVLSTVQSDIGTNFAIGRDNDSSCLKELTARDDLLKGIKKASSFELTEHLNDDRRGGYDELDFRDELVADDSSRFYPEKINVITNQLLSQGVEGEQSNDGGNGDDITKPSCFTRKMRQQTIDVLAPEAVAKTHANTPGLNTSKQSRKLRVSLLHSTLYTNTLYSAMGHVHNDRDILLSLLLHSCGFLKQTPNFFTVVPPKLASRQHLDAFHDSAYLDLIEFPVPNNNSISTISMNTIQNDTQSRRVTFANDVVFPKSSTISVNTSMKLLDSYGLTDDCYLPSDLKARSILWKYCQFVAGASLHAANLLRTNTVDVAINWGGGRHHAHSDKAGGFCYVNDVVLAIQRLIHPVGHGSVRRVLYLDVDIHHADGVQAAFYDTDQVMTISLHYHAPGFFPTASGSVLEKGRHGTSGVGYNLNVPMPKHCSDYDFLSMVRRVLTKIVPVYDPDAVVLSVGADGLRCDPLVGEGWDLSSEALAECVRLTALSCAGNDIEAPLLENSELTAPVAFSDFGRVRKLLILGGGGYHPANTARTFLLCTAAACEGARPGMLWKELPADVPQHSYFHRYGPEFSLKTSFEEFQAKLQDYESSALRKNQSVYSESLRQGERAIYIASIYLKGKAKKAEAAKDLYPELKFSTDFGEISKEDWSFGEGTDGLTTRRPRRHHRKKKARTEQQSTVSESVAA